MTAPPESLAHRIRRIQHESGSVDPRELADKVLATLDSQESIREALAECLHEYVRVVIRTGRNGAMSSAPSRSAKVDAVRDWYERLLAQPVDVSGGGGQWKALRDCTRDDLLSVARHRREAAARNLQTAELYERLAKLMKGDATVGTLSQDVVQGVFGRAAA